MNDFLINLLSIFVGSACTWLFVRRKQDAEIVQLNLENINMAVDIWKETAAQLSAKVELLTKECQQLKSEVVDLRKENKSLKAKLDKTIQTIDQNNK